MGRIFEVRKHAMFARWNRMAKQFARIGKDITIAVKKGGRIPIRIPRCGAASRTRAP
jgi:transcriptional/translational regulatory protein YebC/TACO1